MNTKKHGKGKYCIKKQKVEGANFYQKKNPEENYCHIAWNSS